MTAADHMYQTAKQFLEWNMKNLEAAVYRKAKEKSYDWKYRQAY